MRMKKKMVVFFLVLLTTLCVGIIYFGEYYNTRMIEAKNIVLIDELETNKVYIDPDEVTANKVKWINTYLENKTIEEPEKDMTEAEFLVLLFRLYGVSPLITDNSVNWAAGYYKKAYIEYNYMMIDEERREEEITKEHASEMLSYVLGESYAGEDALNYVSKSGLEELVGLNSESKFISREMGVKMVETLNNNVFYTLLKPNDESKDSFLFFGDSISLGWNANAKANGLSKYGFPNIVGELNENYHIYNLARPGIVSTKLLSALETPLYQSKLKESKRICIDIGSVDLLRPATDFLEEIRNTNGAIASLEQKKSIQNASDQLKNNISLIINRIREVSDSPIYLYSLYNPIPEGVTGAEYGDTILESINNYYKEISMNENSVIYIDSYSLFKGKEDKYVISNEIHPTYEGQKVLASLLLEKLTEEK